MAASAPRAFGTRAEYTTSGERSTRAHTSAAPAIAGTARGETNETASIFDTPVRESIVINLALATTGSGASDCNPSRGPTSRTVTLRTGMAGATATGAAV